MVSLRQLENTAAIRLVKRDELPWEQIRQELYFWLLSKDVESGEAEELVDAAIVRVFASMPDPSHEANPGRIKMDVRMTIGSIRQEQAIERGWFASDIPDDWQNEAPADCHASRLSRLTPTKNTTYVNDAIRLRRETDRLLRRFGHLISTALPNIADDCPESIESPVWCFLFNDPFLASLPQESDTWQAIPVRYEYSGRSHGSFGIAYRTAVDHSLTYAEESLSLFFRNYVELLTETDTRAPFHIFAPPAN